MASVKVTFTLDADTIRRIQAASERLSVPKSQVIRDAVGDYYERIGRLSENERLQMLRVFDELVPRIPARPRRHSQQELNSIRQARRSGGRRTPATRP